MRLQFSGAPEIEAPRAVVWRKLMDPGFVAKSAPGVESVQQLDPMHFKVVSAFGVGAIKVRFNLDIELFDVTEPSHTEMRVRGKAPGSAVDVTSSLTLDELSPARTRLNWTAESIVSGTVASVGARLMEGTARKLTEQFWTDFARRVSQGD
jgi:carbon monoxide dehydrogenase subunit G